MPQLSQLQLPAYLVRSDPQNKGMPLATRIQPEEASGRVIQAVDSLGTAVMRHKYYLMTEILGAQVPSFQHPRVPPFPLPSPALRMLRHQRFAIHQPVHTGGGRREVTSAGGGLPPPLVCRSPGSRAVIGGRPPLPPRDDHRHPLPCSRRHRRRLYRRRLGTGLVVAPLPPGLGICERPPHPAFAFVQGPVRALCDPGLRPGWSRVSGRVTVPWRPVATGYGKADARPLGLQDGGWSPEASASTSPPSARQWGPCGPTSAAGGDSFDCRSGLGGVAQKPLCDCRPCPRPLGLARRVQAQWVPWRPGAPLFSGRRVAALGAGDVARGGARAARVTAEPDTGGRGGDGVATRCGPAWGRRGGPSGNGLGPEPSELGGRRGTGAWCSHPHAARPGPEPQTKWPRRPRLKSGAARTRDCGAEKGRGRRARARTAACVERRPSGTFRELPCCPDPAQLAVLWCSWSHIYGVSEGQWRLLPGTARPLCRQVNCRNHYYSTKKPP
ncbi:translation initiation factor IF-2-like [Sciurus carolinensis]|uniref:translation initiation factor IF-2-like n=1 Tax=Sciurus carolinensis TaxID=30640 RepID=UPI001FB40C81|nr:translation initiation factor IF-2-like [Sciurus carolinensis]